MKDCISLQTLHTVLNVWSLNAGDWFILFSQTLSNFRIQEFWNLQNFKAEETRIWDLQSRKFWSLFKGLWLWHCHVQDINLFLVSTIMTSCSSSDLQDTKQHACPIHDPLGGTQIWFGRGCAASASKQLPIFKGHFGKKGYPLLSSFLKK